MRVRSTPLATFALNEAAEYIAQDNPAAARLLVKHAKKSVASLSRFPNQGRMGCVAGTREFIPGKYPSIIAYRVTRDASSCWM